MKPAYGPYPEDEPPPRAPFLALSAPLPPSAAPPRAPVSVALSPRAFNYVHLFPLTRSVTLQQGCCNYAVGSTAHFAAA